MQDLEIGSPKRQHMDFQWRSISFRKGMFFSERVLFFFLCWDDISVFFCWEICLFWIVVCCSLVMLIGLMLIL